MILPLLIATFAFFYNVFAYFVFTMDQEYISFLAKSLTENFHILWIGVNTADLNFYLGPMFTYFTYIWFLLSGNDPRILAVVASVIGIGTVVCFYFVVRKIFGQKTAWLGSLLLSTFSSYVYFQRIYWNPVFVPIMAVAFFYLLHSRKNRFWPVVYLFLLGLSFHLHLSLLIFALPFAYFFFKDKLFLQLEFYFGILLFTLVNVPLIVFDYIKGGSNIGALFKIFGLFGGSANSGVEQADFLTKIQTIGQVLWFDESKIAILFGFLLLGYILFEIFRAIFIKKKALSKQNLAILIVFLYLSSFILFSHKTPLYYLLGAMPFVVLLLAVRLERITNVYIKYLFVVIWIVLNSWFFVARAGTDRDKMYPSKMRIVNYVITKAKYKPYILQMDNYQNFTGVRYLLEKYYQPPISSSVDPIFGWIYNQYLPIPTASDAKIVRLNKNLFTD